MGYHSQVRKSGPGAPERLWMAGLGAPAEKQKQMQRQKQVLRLRYASLRMTNLLGALGDSQGLKPTHICCIYGTTEVVP
jgi:hypothetical protein